MGSGKSTIGKQLASKLGYKFLDLDNYIERSTGKSITEIFNDKGEDCFRKIESECLKEVLESPGNLIALGGGAPCFHDNIKRIKEFSLSIYLKISPEGLTKRLLRSHTPRPLIKGKTENELLDYIREKLTRREEYYLQADFVIESDSIQVDDLLGLIFT
jgi:shikimate kinase